MAPFFLLGRRRGAFTVIGIDVEVAQRQAGLAVLDETSSYRLLRQRAKGACCYGKSQRKVLHTSCSDVCTRNGS
ncbi:hypothetical protein D3C72_2144620 [compost metagenome]